MKVSEVMERNAVVCSLSDTVRQIARTMRDHDIYAEAIQRDSRNAKARLDLARLLHMQSLNDEAAEQARLAVHILTESGDARAASRGYCDLGWYYYRSGQLDASVLASRSSLDLDPTLFEARFNLGLALLLSGQQERAKEEYRTGMAAVSSADDLKRWAIEDLEEALEEHPRMAASADILYMLKESHQGASKSLIKGMDSA